MPQFTGKIVSTLSSIHWYTKSFVRAVEKTGTNSYCDRATQITGDLFFFLPFFLFHVDERREEYWQTASTSPISSRFSQLRVPACFYSSEWPSFFAPNRNGEHHDVQPTLSQAVRDNSF